MKKKTKKLSKKAYERSAKDKRIDKRFHLKEGSKRDERMDTMIRGGMKLKDAMKKMALK